MSMTVPATVLATVPLAALWLPVALSAVFVFVGSAVVWMFLKWHDSEWHHLGMGSELQEALRKAGVTTGHYLFPYMDMKATDKAAAKAAWTEAYARGPVGVIHAGTPGKMNMGKMLGQVFVFYLVVSFFAAYVAAHALAQGAPYLRVFQLVGATTFAAYGAGSFMDSIWFGKSWRSTWLNAVDALIYACLTAGTFGWLWPR
jgi:hypothetical protein